MNEKRRTRIAPEILHSEKTITADLLRKLFDEHILKGRLKMPTDEALEKLASVLEYWRGYFLHDQAICPLETEASKLTRQLAENLQSLQKSYDALGGISPPSIQKKIVRIDTAICALNCLYPVLIETVGPALSWQWLSNALPGDFAAAICSTNPHYKIAIGHSGPLARFVSAVAPHLTGEYPKTESVATQLKDFKRKYLREKNFGDHILHHSGGE